MGICHRQTNATLFDLQKWLTNGIISKPQWQRDDAWSPKKKEQFEKTVLDKAKVGSDILSGCVVLYKIEGDDRLWLSDGLQRTLNSQRLYQKLVAERGPIAAEQLLSRISVPMLEMRYINEKEAKDEFRRMNQGTPLTEFEQAKTILTDLPNYQDWENRILSRLHTVVSNRMLQFGVRNAGARGRIKGTTSRKKDHKDQRDDFALFLRFIIEDKNPQKYYLDVTHIDDEKKRTSLLEQRLADALRNLGIDEAEKRLYAFEAYLTDESQYLRGVWDRIEKTPPQWDASIQTVTPSCLRYLFHVALYRKNNRIPLDRYTAFLTKFFPACQGTLQVTYPDLDGRKCDVINSGDIVALGRVQQKLGCIFDPQLDHNKKRKRQKTDQLLPGMHNGHRKPFSKNPDGDDEDVVPISARENVSVGVG